MTEVNVLFLIPAACMAGRCPGDSMVWLSARALAQQRAHARH